MDEQADYILNVLLPKLKKLNSDLLNYIRKHRSEVEKIALTGAGFDNVVSFGCGKGDESIALMLILGAKNVVGIDKDDARIEQAKRDIHDLQQNIKKIINLSPCSLKSLQTLDDIHLALKLLGRCEDEEFKLPFYQSGDMVQGEASTHLPSNYFDLAYCHYVLYHIYCTDEGVSIDDTISAVQEMARVVRVGGLIVAVEPETCSPGDDTTVNLHPFFEEAGLQAFSTNNSRHLTNFGYVYLKVG